MGFNVDLSEDRDPIEELGDRPVVPTEPPRSEVDDVELLGRIVFTGSAAGGNLPDTAGFEFSEATVLFPWLDDEGKCAAALEGKPLESDPRTTAIYSIKILELRSGGSCAHKPQNLNLEKTRRIFIRTIQW